MRVFSRRHEHPLPLTSTAGDTFDLNTSGSAATRPVRRYPWGMDPFAAHDIIADPDLALAIAEYRRVLRLHALLQLANGSRGEELVLVLRARGRAAESLAARLDALLQAAGA